MERGSYSTDHHLSAGAQAGTAMKAMPRHSGAWEGAPDQKHSYLEGRLPGKH